MSPRPVRVDPWGRLHAVPIAAPRSTRTDRARLAGSALDHLPHRVQRTPPRGAAARPLHRAVLPRRGHGAGRRAPAVLRVPARRRPRRSRRRTGASAASQRSTPSCTVSASRAAHGRATASGRGAGCTRRSTGRRSRAPWPSGRAATSWSPPTAYGGGGPSGRSGVNETTVATTSRRPAAPKPTTTPPPPPISAGATPRSRGKWGLAAPEREPLHRRLEDVAPGDLRVLAL